MTPVRREVVSVLARQKTPKTAYQLLALLNKKRKNKLSAISLYRTLEFLIEAGVALKLESKNAFELCLNDRPEHGHLLMVCDKCGDVREIESLPLSHALASAARECGHALKHPVIELHGICQHC